MLSMDELSQARWRMPIMINTFEFATVSSTIHIICCPYITPHISHRSPGCLTWRWVKNIAYAWHKRGPIVKLISRMWWGVPKCIEEFWECYSGECPIWSPFLWLVSDGLLACIINYVCILINDTNYIYVNMETMPYNLFHMCQTSRLMYEIRYG